MDLPGSILLHGESLSYNRATLCLRHVLHQSGYIFTFAMLSKFIFLSEICQLSLLVASFLPIFYDHACDAALRAMVFQIISVSDVCSTVCSGVDKRKHQSSTSLAFVRAIHRWPVNSPHKGPVTWKMFPFGDVIMSVNRLKAFQDFIWNFSIRG